MIKGQSIICTSQDRHAGPTSKKHIGRILAPKFPGLKGRLSCGGLQKFMKTTFISFLTHIGPLLSRRTILQLHGIVNYLEIGRWMKDHHFVVSERRRNRDAVWDTVAKDLRHRQVLYLEFGVSYGESMSYWSRELKHPGSILHGFDSFEGLPEEGGPWTKGQFCTGGRIPLIEDQRVRFFKGWFNEVLPTYSLPPHEKLVINMDADLYSSTISALRYLRPHIKPGTLIYFDEMNYLEHEPRAFAEFMAESGLKFRVACADKTMAFVFFECIGEVVEGKNTRLERR